jgi:acetylglutamate kinase
MSALLKLSGKALERFIEDPLWMQVIRALRAEFGGLVLVHGGGAEISKWSEAQGFTTTFIQGQRVTTPEIMRVVLAVQCGLINGRIVNHLITSGFEATGLNGMDRNLFVAERFDENLGLVGIPKIENSPDWVHALLNDQVIPVFSSVCRSREGDILNVNADIFAQAIAKSLEVEAALFVSDIPGIRIEGAVQPSLTPDEIEKFTLSQDITGGMIPKTQSAVQLINAHVGRVWIGSSDPNDLLDLFSGVPRGTWITREKEEVYVC